MMERSSQRGAVRCFTLVEALLVVLTLAIVIAIALPSLGRSRAAASLIRIHAIASGLGAATQMYTTDYRGTLPYLGVPGKPWEGPWIDGQRPEVSYMLSDPPSYFSQSLLYANLLVEGYFDGRHALYFSSFIDQARSDPHFITPYQMTYGACAAPSYWVGEGPPDTLAGYRAVALHEAAFPSAKGLILHVESGIYAANPRLATRTLTVGLVDGSAGSKPADSGMWDRVMSRPYGAAPIPVLNTPAGLAGRDFSW